MLKINFKIVTPERTVFDQEVDQVTLPTVDGEITILPNHISYISFLKVGEVVLKDGDEEISMAISGGFIEFDKNKLIVLADTAEHAEEINLDRAEEGRRKAEKLKEQEVTMDEVEFARIAAAIEKEIVRIKVAKKHHTKR